MSDMTSDTPIARHRRGEPGLEYWAYFAPVFALSLPLSAFHAAKAVVTSDNAPRRGIVAEAWCRAKDVTTTICSI